MNQQPIDFVLLIPCYNNSEGLQHSLKSISYPKNKCEILIIDDGSTLPLNENELQKIYELTIQVIRLAVNGGIVNALNTGLNKLRSRNDIKYIARLDAGDSCSEHRFYRQVDFLNAHPDIALLASWARFENNDTCNGYDYITKITHPEILKEMHFKCSFIHPSVMFRAEVLNTVGIYPQDYPHAEDYAFFWKIIQSYKGAVLPEKLVKINFSEKNVSSKNYKKQLRSRKRIVKKFGNNSIYKWIGLAILNTKLLLPARLVLFLKSRD